MMLRSRGRKSGRWYNRTVSRASIHWPRVTVGIVVGAILLAAAFAVWYWLAVWLPQKESRAMRVYFENFLRQQELQRTSQVELR